MKGKLFFFAQFPPPVHGASSVNEFLYQKLSTETGLEIIKLSFIKNSKYPLIFYFNRFIRVIAALIVILKNYRTARRSVFYMPVSGGYGMAFEIIPWLFASFIFKKRVMHHHSFQYCYKKSGLMNCMQSVQKENIHNVFLCNCHRRVFGEKYVINNGQTSVVSNEIVLEKQYAVVNNGAVRSKSKIITVGHISNLTIEKGFDTFCTIVREMAANKNVKFELAGPAATGDIKNAIKALEAAYPDTFTYRSAIYGKDKMDWYNTLDFFIFPSAYNNEAYPLVVSEAILSGVIPLTTPIGCLPEYNDGEFVFPADVFTDNALAILSKASADSNYLQQLRETQDKITKTARAKSTADYAVILQLFTGALNAS